MTNFQVTDPVDAFHALKQTGLQIGWRQENCSGYERGESSTADEAPGWRQPQSALPLPPGGTRKFLEMKQYIQNIQKYRASNKESLYTYIKTQLQVVEWIIE